MPARRQSKKRNSRAKSVSFKRASNRSNVTGKGRYTVRKRAVRSRVHQAPAGPLETLGRMAGKAIGGWLGSGDYVSTSGNTVLAPDPPKISMGRDAVTITHREYLSDIISSSTANTFKIQKFGLNPSDMNTFPWLANVTQPNYQQFNLNSLYLNSVHLALMLLIALIRHLVPFLLASIMIIVILILLAGNRLKIQIGQMLVSLPNLCLYLLNVIPSRQVLIMVCYTLLMAITFRLVRILKRII